MGQETRDMKLVGRFRAIAEALRSPLVLELLSRLRKTH